MGTKVGLWEGLYTALADSLFEFGGGRVLTRTTAAAVVGDTSITVESTDRFPAAGDLSIDGRVYRYTAKTATTFTGLDERIGPVTISGTAGLVEDLRAYSPVMDDSKEQTQLDQLRASFLVKRADGADLDILGRNYNVPRPLGLSDADYRLLLNALIAVEAQTIYCLEKALDVLAPVYEIYEKMPVASAYHKVYVGIPGAGDVESQGKAYIAGWEAQTRSTTTTVVVDDDVLVPYGVYADTDYRREGQNYAEQPFGASAGSTAGADPQRLTDGTNSPFVAGDADRYVVMDMPSGNTQHWRILAYVDASNVDLGWYDQSDGRVDVSVDPNRFLTRVDWFPPWVAEGGTEDCELVIATGPNAGVYSITAVIGPYEVAVSPAFSATETDIVWSLRPNFGANTITEYRLPRATAAAATVTTPVTMPADVLVDYTNVESAEVPELASDNAETQRAFYIFQFGYIIQQVMDTLVAAGVDVEVEMT